MTSLCTDQFLLVEWRSSPWPWPSCILPLGLSGHNLEWGLNKLCWIVRAVEAYSALSCIVFSVFSLVLLCWGYILIMVGEIIIWCSFTARKLDFSDKLFLLFSDFAFCLLIKEAKQDTFLNSSLILATYGGSYNVNAELFTIVSVAYNEVC